MINKTFYVIIFIYTISFSVLAGQYTLADIYNIELQNYRGEPIKSAIIETAGLNKINEVSRNIIITDFDEEVDGHPFDRVIDFNVGMAYVVWEVVLLLSGAYVFYILYLLGIPLFVVGAIIIIYSILLFRTIVGVLRGF